MDFHLRGRLSVAKIERFIRAIKIIVFDLALLVLFVVFLLRVVRQELGWWPDLYTTIKLDTDLLDYIRLENEKDVQHLVAQ